MLFERAMMIVKEVMRSMYEVDRIDVRRILDNNTEARGIAENRQPKQSFANSFEPYPSQHVLLVLLLLFCLIGVDKSQVVSVRDT